MLVYRRKTNNYRKPWKRKKKVESLVQNAEHLQRYPPTPGGCGEQDEKLAGENEHLRDELDGSLKRSCLLRNGLIDRLEAVEEKPGWQGNEHRDELDEETTAT